MASCAGTKGRHRYSTTAPRAKSWRESRPIGMNAVSVSVKPGCGLSLISLTIATRRRRDDRRSRPPPPCRRLLRALAADEAGTATAPSLARLLGWHRPRRRRDAPPGLRPWTTSYWSHRAPTFLPDPPPPP